MLITMLGILQFIFIYLSIKVLSRDKTADLKELIYALMMGGFSVFIYQYLDIWTVFLIYLMLIFLWLKKSNIFETVIFCSFGVMNNILSDHIASFLRYIIFNSKSTTTNEIFLLHIPIYYIVGGLLSFIGSITLYNILNRIRDLNKRPVILSALSCVICLAYIFSVVVARGRGNQQNPVLYDLGFLILFLLLFSGILLIYISISNLNFAIKKKETAYAYMERYTQDVEKHYLELRKFKHDYQNILTSLEGYIMLEDMNGLKEYFYDKIKKHSKWTLQNEYILKELSNVKIDGIKSIIAAKIIYAQDLGLNASFEALEEIERIDMDTICLVRVLGILLDNAIEELTYLGHGSLLLGIIKNKDNVMIVIQNTCRDKIPNIQTLKRQSFSTKSSGRGLGLSNMQEIIESFSNVISETLVEKELFVQKLIIFNEVRK